MANTNEEIINQLKPLFKEHDYDQLYYKQDIVTYQINGTTNFYQAIRNVPRYVPITDRTYWNQLNVAESNTPVDNTDDVDYLCFTANEDNSFLLLNCYISEEYAEEESNSFPKSAGVNTSNMTPHQNPPFVLEYSIDKINWSVLNMYQFDNDGDFILISDTISFEHARDKIYFRGDNINGTYFSDDSSKDLWYEAIFVSSSDSTFAVSGDLQTIVDKTGNDKEHGCFDSLFAIIIGSVFITSAPDLTATSFINNKYNNLFEGQVELLRPATMPNITISDLEGLYSVFVAMYSRSGIQEPANFNSITINSGTDHSLFGANFNYIYARTTFDITNDNITLNGFEGIECPNIDSAYTLANNILMNTNGFNPGNAYLYHAEVRIVDGTVYNIAAPDSVYIFNYVMHYNDDAIGEAITIHANGDSGASFDKWEVSYDNGSTWEDAVNDVIETIANANWTSELNFNLPDTSCIIRGTYTHPMN